MAEPIDNPSFGSRLAAVVADKGRLCVGIDPHDYLLSEWNLPANAAGLKEFGLRVVAQAASQVGIVKPQIAFFERFGSAGFAALEAVLAAARAAGLMVIADVKRGDIGSSMAGYGQAWLTPGHPLEVDAITVNPFQGLGSLNGTIRLAEESGKGVFVLAATSNPEAVEIQTAVIADGEHRGSTVAAGIVSDVDEWNMRSLGTGSGGTGLVDAGLGSVGIVLGATVDFAKYGIDMNADFARATPVLAPGFGHQGVHVSDFPELYRARAKSTIITESRSVLSAGPDGVARAVAQIKAQIVEHERHG